MQIRILYFIYGFIHHFPKCIFTWGQIHSVQQRERESKKKRKYEWQFIQVCFSFLVFRRRRQKKILYRTQLKRWKSFVNLISVAIFHSPFGSQLDWCIAYIHIQRHQLIWLNAFRNDAIHGGGRERERERAAEKKMLWNLLDTIQNSVQLMDSQYAIESIIHIYAKFVRFIPIANGCQSFLYIHRRYRHRHIHVCSLANSQRKII